jgi:hypothetical protein
LVKVIRNMRIGWKANGLKIGLIISLFLGTHATGILPIPEMKAATETVYIPTNEWSVDPNIEGNYIITQGRMMVPVREAAHQFQMGLYTSFNTKTVTLLNHDHRIVFQTGSKTAVLDGEKVMLDAAPQVVKGRTYVPFRFLAQALGYSIGKRDTSYFISFKNSYVRGQLGNETYWMNKSDGGLYYSKGTAKPERIGKLDMQIFDLGAWGFDVKKTGSDTIMISMLDVYGEPHLHDAIYHALLQHNKVLLETKTDYYGLLPHNNVKTYEGYLVLIDGHVAKLVDPESGKVAQSYDMAALTGGSSEGRYVLEYISEDFLLIRPYHNALLTAVNLETNRATILYKEILTPEWIEILESWPLGNDYPGDQLRFVKRSQNEFVFEFTDRFNDEKKTTYKYTMK